MEIRDYLGRLRKELEDTQLEYEKAKKEYNAGKRLGKSYAMQGIDMGSQSKEWLKASDYWRQGYREGWKENCFDRNWEEQNGVN